MNFVGPLFRFGAVLLETADSRAALSVLLLGAGLAGAALAGALAAADDNAAGAAEDAPFCAEV